mgnify:FL=1
MNRNAFVEQMQFYIPESACAIAYDWIQLNPVLIKITKPRKTKLGDYRPKGKDGKAIMTVNGNLNEYSFLITFTHEIAHHIDYLERRTLQNPHGQNWKKVYSGLLSQLLDGGCFSNDLELEVKNHINNPKAASCSDPILLSKLNEFDTETVLRLTDIPEGELFRMTSNNRVFLKGALKRTRFRCEEKNTGRFYMVHGQCQVESIVS